MNIFSSPCLHASQSIVSFFTTGSAFLSFLVVLIETNKSTRPAFPNNLALVFSLVGIGFNLTLGLGPVLDFRQIHEFKTDRMFHSFCIGQGFLFQFFATCSVFWYVAFTNIMHDIIVKRRRAKDVAQRKARVYFLAVVLPLVSALIPLAAGKYGPRYIRGSPETFEGSGLECWLEDPFWQLAAMLVWLLAALLWCGYRGYQIVLVLKKTKFKTERTRSQGVMNNKRGCVRERVKRARTRCRCCRLHLSEPTHPPPPCPRYKLVQTLKETYRRNLFLLIIYSVFCVIIFA
jgi:hypothetical protein